MCFAFQFLNLKLTAPPSIHIIGFSPHCAPQNLRTTMSRPSYDRPMTSAEAPSYSSAQKMVNIILSRFAGKKVLTCQAEQVLVDLIVRVEVVDVEVHQSVVALLSAGTVLDSPSLDGVLLGFKFFARDGMDPATCTGR